MTELAPFRDPPPVCPKCGFAPEDGDAMTPRFESGLVLLSAMFGQKSVLTGPEHLVWSCGRCDYHYSTQPKDAA